MGRRSPSVKSRGHKVAARATRKPLAVRSKGKPGRAVVKTVDDSPAGQRFRSASDILTQILTSRVSDPYMDSGPVKRAVDKIAGALAAIPFKIYQKAADENEEVTSGPIVELFETPSGDEEMLGTQLFEATAIHLKNDGEVVWGYDALVTNPNGGPKIPSEIRVLNPRWLTPKVERRTGKLILWDYRPPGTGTTQHWSREQTTHFKQYNPYAPIRGLATLQGGRRDIDQEFWAKTWIESLLQNSSQLGNVFSPIGERAVGKDAAQRMIDILNERQGGPGKAYKDIFLEHAIKVDRSTATPKEMLFKELLSFSREEAGGNFGVPPLFMGILEFANYANARVQERLLWHGSVLPLKNYIEKVINVSFFRRFAPTLMGQFDTSEVPALKDDTGEKIGWAKILHEMAFTGNEINKLLDLGFEEKPWRDHSFLSFTLVPAESLIDSTPEDLSGGGSKDVPPAKSIEKDAVPEAPFPRSMLKTEEQRARYWKGFIRGLLPIENRTAAQMRGFFARQKREMLDRLHANEKTVTRGRVAKQSNAQRIDAILFDDEEEGTKLQVIMRPLITQAMKTGADQLLAEIGTGGTFNVNDPAAAALLRQRLEGIKDVNDTTATRLRDSLGQGMDAGESVEQLAGRVRGVFDSGPARSRMIARTEVGSAANGGRFEAMKEEAIEKHEWLSARDTAVRESHAIGSGEDGNIVPVGTEFPVTGLLYPQQEGGDASEVVNCRCVALAAT